MYKLEWFIVLFKTYVLHNTLYERFQTANSYKLIYVNFFKALTTCVNNSQIFKHLENIRAVTFETCEPLTESPSSVQQTGRTGAELHPITSPHHSSVSSDSFQSSLGNLNSDKQGRLWNEK